MQKHLIVILGPTASGKTALAINLAKRYDTEILSADSRQFYKEMSIGTAKPTQEELSQAHHYFIDTLSIEEPYSAGDYERDAIQLLENLFKEKDKVVLAGGSGLFIRAVLEGLDKFPDVPDIIKDKYIQLEKEKGLVTLQQLLSEKDPKYFEEVDINNPHRLIRALSVIETSGKPFSSFRNKSSKKRNFKPILIALEWDRNILYDRINKRVDLMLEAGLLDEVKNLHSYKELNALQTVGYQEIFNYLDGEYSLDKAIELIKRNSRRYAKRQTTWIKKVEGITSFHPSEISLIYEHIDTCINQEK